MPRGTQVKRDGLIITVERRGISSWIALRHLSCPGLVCQGPHWRRDCPLTCRPHGSDSQDNPDWRYLGGPHTSSHSNYTWGNPGINNCGGSIRLFILDTGATFSVLTEAPGLLSSRSITIMRLSGWAKHYYFSHPLSCNWGSVLFSQEFLIVAESPSPLLGRDILSKVQHCFHEYGACSFSPIKWTKCKS